MTADDRASRGSGAAGELAHGQMLARRHMRPAEMAAALFFVAFLAVQLAVPIVQLVSAPRPARFGWQMYSVGSMPPRFDLLLRDGTSQPVALESYVTSFRADVPLVRFVPPHLCQIFPQAVAVRYQRDEGSESGTYICNS